MGFPKVIYEKASATLADRRQRARDIAAAQKEEVYRVLPEVQNIDIQLAQIGRSTIQAVAAAPERLDVVLERLKDQSLALQERRLILLREAGIEDAYFQVPYCCPDCQDTGYVQNKRCACFDKLLKQTAYQHLGAAQLGQYQFSNFSLNYYSTVPLPPNGVIPRERMATVKTICMTYATNFTPTSPSLLFLGGTGLGKTHLSLAIAEQVIEKGYGVVYSSAQNLMARLEKEKFSYDRYQDDPDATSYQNLVLECDLLIIDDLGTEFLSTFVNSMIYNIVNTRLIEQRPCIISTNLELAEISKRYSERLVSRLFGGYRRLDFIGKDIRIQRGLLSPQKELYKKDS